MSKDQQAGRARGSKNPSRGIRSKIASSSGRVGCKTCESGADFGSSCRVPAFPALPPGVERRATHYSVVPVASDARPPGETSRRGLSLPSVVILPLCAVGGGLWRPDTDLLVPKLLLLSQGLRLRSGCAIGHKVQRVQLSGSWAAQNRCGWRLL